MALIAFSCMWHCFQPFWDILSARGAVKSITMTQRKDSKKKTNLILIIMISILLMMAVFLNIDRRSTNSGTADDLMEAVFRYQFAHNCSASQDEANAYYIGISNDRDPSDDFMKRFVKNKPTVKKISKSIIFQKDLGYRVIDRETGQEGLIFRITSVRFLNDEMAEVKGGYYEASLSSSENTYQLVQTGKTWKVIKDTCNWQS